LRKEGAYKSGRLLRGGGAKRWRAVRERFRMETNALRVEYKGGGTVLSGGSCRGQFSESAY